MQIQQLAQLAGKAFRVFQILHTQGTAGDFVFVPYVGASKKNGSKTGRVEVLRASDGSAAGHIEPGDEVGEVGLQDIRETLTAHRRSNGEYIILIEDDYKSKVVMYRWKP